MMLDYSKHKTILLKILNNIFSDASISCYLGFKGGTAAMLFYGLDRNSVDLDLDFIKETNDDEKLKDVFEKIKKIILNYGEIKDEKIKNFSFIVVLSYSPEVQNIKVEVNLRNFFSKYETKNFLGISIPVMVKEDMFAHKLMAMYERMEKANRDIYDVYFFEKNNWEINKKIVEERAGMSFKKLLEECIERLEKKESKDILKGLGDFLDSSQKSWVKNNLIKETISLLSIKLNTLSPIDSLDPFTNREVLEIKKLLNQKLKKINWQCEDLKIEKDEISWSQNDYGYRVEVVYNKKNKIVFNPEKKINKKDFVHEIILNLHKETESKEIYDKLM